MSVRPPPGRSPAPGLPLSYMVVAASTFVLATAGVAWLAPALAGHYYQPRLLALTHTITLGWITLTILGASYQLIPVVLERPLWSERLARWQLLLFAGGIIGMAAHFWLGLWSGLVWAAGLTGVGVGTHLVNTALTVRGLARWTFTARLVAGGLAGLVLTALFGLALGADRAWRFLPGDLFANLHAHVHLALLGWVLPMVIGVTARVYPMFLLAREPEGWPGRLQLWGLAAGVPSVVAGLVLSARWLVAAGAIAVAAAVAGHLVWVGAIVRSRKRPALDWGLRFALTGAAFLVPATLLGLALAVDVVSGPRVALAYAVLALGGWVSMTIVGMTLKIVPFLVWYRAYGPRVGRVVVPTLGGLSWPRAEAAAWPLLAGGMAALAVAVALGDPVMIRVSGLTLVAGALLFAAALGRILAHLRSRDGAVEPRTAPLRARTS